MISDELTFGGLPGFIPQILGRDTLRTTMCCGLEVDLFRGGLVFKADRLLYHSTLGLRGTKKKKEVDLFCREEHFDGEGRVNPAGLLRTSVLLLSLELSDTQVYET